MSMTARSATVPHKGHGYIWRSDQRAAPTFSPGTERERVSALTRAVTVAALEVLAGSRPASQLMRWTSAEIVEKLRRRAEVLKYRRLAEPAQAPVHAAHRHAEVLRQRVCHVAEGVYEVALVIRDDSRTRAVVLRAERPQNAWLVTVLEIG